MADEKNADRSSIEIKTLLRKLHPDRGNHRDRVRALTKFRNYVMGGGVSAICSFLSLSSIVSGPFSGISSVIEKVEN